MASRIEFPLPADGSLELADWQPLAEIPPGNAAISQATVKPAEWTMTRTSSDSTMPSILR